MQDFAHKKIVLGVCGGIAAYKSAHLIRELTKVGASVRVVMTTSAQEFITPMTLQALSGDEVRSTLFDSQAERAMGHIELARWADYFIIAPASANCLAKMAHGIADDLLSTIYLVAQVPVIICPAMNRSMWQHPAVRANCDVLVARGVTVVGPEEGSQACGEYGFGRMSKACTIINALRLVEVKHTLKGLHVLITAGPTREAIDPVRYISNHSSGKMGYALAQAAHMAGARVTLISGPTHIDPPDDVEFVRVDTALAMLDAVNAHLQEGTIFIATAAVADYAVATPAVEKLKKSKNATLTLTLVKNPDILASVALSGKAAFVVGFAAETTAVLEHAAEKLHAKKLDMIIANQVGDGIGFDRDENQVSLLTKTEQMTYPLMHKVRLAGQIIDKIADCIKSTP